MLKRAMFVRGWGERESRGQLLSKDTLSSWESENIWEEETGDDCTTLSSAGCHRITHFQSVISM